METPRLSLDNLQARDATGPYLSWMQDADVLRFLEPRDGGYDGESLAEYISAMNDSAADLLLAMVRKDDASHIGNIKLGGIDGKKMDAHIGILIGDTSAWGQGFASEAIAAVAGYAGDTLGLKRVYAGCHVTNTGSCKAFAKAGFTEESRREKASRIDGEWVDGLTLARSLP